MGLQPEELSSLYAISREVTASLDLNEVISSAFRELDTAVSPDLMLLYLCEGDRIKLEAAWPAQEEYGEVGVESKRLGQCLCGLAAEGKNVYSKDLHADPACTLHDCKQAGIHSLAALPLFGRDGVLGVFALLSLVERDFRERSSFLEAMAAQIANSLQNALLHRKVQEYAQVQEALVAKLREAQATIRKGEAHYRKLLDTMHDGVAAADADGLLTYANNRFLELFGLEEHELMGRRFSDLLDEPNRNRWLEQQAARKRGISSTYELEIPRRDGTRMFCVASGAPLTDEMGRFAGSLGILTDITERKRAEESLQKQHRTLQLLAEYNDLISGLTVDAVVDGTLRFLGDRLGFHETSIALLNERRDAFHLAASTHSEAVGITSGFPLPLHAAVLSEVIQQTQPRYRPDIASERPRYEIDAHLLQAGQQSDFLVPLWAENQCLGTLNISRPAIDAFPEADRRLIALLAPRLAQALHNAQLFDSLEVSEHKYRGLVENTPDIIYSFSNKRGGLYYSPRVVSVLGYSLAELSEDPFLWHDAIHPDDLAKVDGVIDEMKEQDGFEMEYRIRDAQGKWHWFRDRSVRFDMVDDEIIVHGLAADITEQRELENQLRQAQKMEAVGQLAGGIAHDFNNMLTAVMGYASIMQMSMNPTDPLRAHLDNILGAARRASKLTQSLLAFSRKQVVDKQPVDLNEVVRDVEKILVPVIGEDIQTKIDLAAGPLSIHADCIQLEQILINLANNARDAMVSGGVLSIETKAAVQSEAGMGGEGFGTVGDYALLCVSDTGAGMDNQTLQRIFEPFFTTKQVGRGTGLGLSMVYGMVEQHGGSIRVVSQPGQGTTVNIFFPRIMTETETETPRPEAEALPKCGRETILLAEDDGTIRKLFHRILTDAGYTVIAAENGQDGLEKFLENEDRIEFLITDVIMPKKTGRELFDAIRARKPVMKALFISGYAEDRFRERDLPEAGTHFVYKPLLPLDLLRMVRRILDE